MRSVSSATAVRKMIGKDAPSRKLRQSESPSSPGIMMSRTIRSKTCRFDMPPGFRRVRRRRHPHAVLHKKLGEQITNVFMIINNKNMKRSFHGLSSCQCLERPHYNAASNV